MTRRDKYHKHLASKEWEEQRDIALSRTSGFCQFCGEVATQVHHVKYPKQFGEEHPHSLIPVCDRCHNISHGIQEMKTLTDATRMTELSPTGDHLKYLLSGGRVYASAESWARALRVPEPIMVWFTTGLARTAMLKKDLAGGDLEMSYLNKAVYRWHAVADQLRVFDREWNRTQYRSRSDSERKEIEQFYKNYERLVSWGYDLQERALHSVLNATNSANTPITQETLLAAIKDAVAPRLRQHDDKLNEHDVVIAEIKDAVPILRDQDEFITVKQAIHEQGFDPTLMPLHPQSRETLSGLAGQLLKTKRVKPGASVIARVDGQSITAEMRTYKRRDIYAVLMEIMKNKQEGLRLEPE